MPKTEISWTESHQEGKPHKEIEIGIQYPDGTISWNTDFASSRYDIGTKEGREGVQHEFDLKLKNLGALPTRPLVFLQRKKITKYTEPQVIS
jgi:hypothetical protein